MKRSAIVNGTCLEIKIAQEALGLCTPNLTSEKNSQMKAWQVKDLADDDDNGEEEDTEKTV